MKTFAAFFGLAGICFGIGFFAGERYGRKQVKQNLEKEDQDAETDTVTPEELGYISDECQSEKMDNYLAEHEHPDEADSQETEETEENDISLEPLDDFIEVFFDEDRWDNETAFDCRDLTYYVEDEILCDEDEKRIDDPQELIGSTAIALMLQTASPVIFVRNSWSEVLYRISRVDNAYGRAVLGIDL